VNFFTIGDNKNLYGLGVASGGCVPAGIRQSIQRLPRHRLVLKIPMASAFPEKTYESFRVDVIGIVQLDECLHVQLLVKDRSRRAYGRAVSAAAAVGLVGPGFHTTVIDGGETATAADGDTVFAFGTQIFIDGDPGHLFAPLVF
jgi:hypothetical protein